VRSAVLQLPNARTAGERRKVLRAAVRQLERAEVYFDAVEYMDVDDRQARRALAQLKSDLRSLTAYLVQLRSATPE
jgi:lysylphosphatidylglycerol synthetase-like protein (DUF2156 family)